MADSKRTLGPEDEVNVMRGAFRHGRHVGTLDRALRNGELPFRWEDGRRLIKVRDLDAWAARSARHGRPTLAAPEAFAS